MKFKILMILMLVAAVNTVAGRSIYYLFIGSYTDGKPADGIYVYSFDTITGRLQPVGHAHNIINPSFITIAPGGKYLYACTESQTEHAGSVSAFRFDSITGKLTFINKQSSEGENPVYAVVDKTGQWLINADYTEAAVAVHAIDHDGSLEPANQVITFTDSGINKERQNKAHIHAAVFSPQQDRLFLPDLGADKIRAYDFVPADSSPLHPAVVPFTRTVPGSGPRHFTFSPGGQYAYCIEELSGAVAVFEYTSGVLKPLQSIFSYARHHAVYGSADIHISPDGRFLYASNRIGENTVSIFAIDAATGKLTLVGHQNTMGEHPRNFTIDPTGRFLLVANQLGNNVIVFKRDIKTGKLTPTGTQLYIHHPSCLQIRSYTL